MIARRFVSCILLAFMPLCIAVGAGAQEGMDRAERVRQRVTQILSSGQYATRPQEKTILDRIGVFLREGWQAIVDFFNGLGISGGSSPAMSQIIYILVLTVVVIFAGLAIMWLVNHLSGRKRPERRPAKLREVSFEELATNSTPAELLLQAEDLASKRQFRAAYRLAFLAALKQLDVVGALRFDASRTNGEVVRNLRAKQPLYALMRPAALDFDVRLYGGGDVGEDDFKRVAELPAKIEQAVPA